MLFAKAHTPMRPLSACHAHLWQSFSLSRLGWRSIRRKRQQPEVDCSRIIRFAPFRTADRRSHAQNFPTTAAILDFLFELSYRTASKAFPKCRDLIGFQNSCGCHSRGARLVHTIPNYNVHASRHMYDCWLLGDSNKSVGSLSSCRTHS